MNHFLRPSIAAMLSIIFLLSVDAFAQDHAQMEKELESLIEQVKAKEQEFLSPSAEDRAMFGEFLKQSNTGLIRLLPREKYDNKLTLRGGGAFYSFTRLAHEYNSGSDISLERGEFSVGFSGANFGFLANLGDIALEDVTLEHPGVYFLAALVTPSKEPEARQQQRSSGNGLMEGAVNYRRSVFAHVGQTYVVRSINYGTSDVLVAFHLVRRDSDGSLILLWKMLKRFPTPYLERA